jgi:putative transposase
MPCVCIFSSSRGKFGSVRAASPVLDHFLGLSERHLYRLMKQYQEYFNRARPHQGIGQKSPCQPVRGAEPQMIGDLISRPVLGGLHEDYRRRRQDRPSYPRAA